MKLAAIDIGTNSMRLLIADYIDDEFFNREKLINTTRIGEGVDSKGYISKEAIDRNIIALKEFVNLAKNKGCTNVKCIGTSALRDSKNKLEFLNRAKSEVGIEVDVISGEEESSLGFYGILKGIKQTTDILAIDIGGGSTEFIFGSLDGIEFSKSENIGALRMTEKFLNLDYIDEIEFEKMQDFILKSLNKTLEIIKGKNVSTVVGIGGTITSVSAINQKLEQYSMEKIHGSKICKKDLDYILQKLKKMTLIDKKNLKGLQPKRADIITAGVAILNLIMKKLEKETIIVSEYDNLEGLLCQMAKKMS